MRRRGLVRIEIALHGPVWACPKGVASRRASFEPGGVMSVESVTTLAIYSCNASDGPWKGRQSHESNPGYLRDKVPS